MPGSATRNRPMCYSSQIIAEQKAYERQFGARIDIRRYVELYWNKAGGSP